MNWKIKVLFPANTDNEDLDDVSKLRLFVYATKYLFKFDPSLEITSLVEPYSDGSSILKSLEDCKTQSEIDSTKDSISESHDHDFSETTDDLINSFYDQFDYYHIWIDPTDSNESDNFMISSSFKKSEYPSSPVKIYPNDYEKENEELQQLHDLYHFGKKIFDHEY